MLKFAEPCLKAFLYLICLIWVFDLSSKSFECGFVVTDHAYCVNLSCHYGVQVLFFLFNSYDYGISKLRMWCWYDVRHYVLVSNQIQENTISKFFKWLSCWIHSCNACLYKGPLSHKVQECIQLTMIELGDWRVIWSCSSKKWTWT